MKNFLIFLSTIILLTIFTPSTTFAQQQAGASANLATMQLARSEDRRVQVLRGFLKKWNSPLSENAETFVKTADKYRLDWRFVTAISGVESTFGHALPYGSYNAWGWGIYGDNMITFPSYDSAIETISKSLRENYIDSWGAKDEYQIGRLYAASPTWTQRVVGFMQQISDYDANTPETALSLSI